MKTCKICNEPKAADGFYARGGLVCIECTKARVRTNRAANRDYYRKLEATRKRGKHRPTVDRVAANARSLKYYYANKQKHLARTKVSKALAAGRLVKPKSCSRCQKPAERLEAHHADYSKPLDVTWLCDPCHSTVHRKVDTTGFVPRKSKWVASPPKRAESCHRGHPLSGSNIYVDASGRRFCKACRARRLREYRERNSTQPPKPEAQS